MKPVNPIPRIIVILIFLSAYMAGCSSALTQEPEQNSFRTNDDRIPITNEPTDYPKFIQESFELTSSYPARKYSLEQDGFVIQRKLTSGTYEIFIPY